MKRITSFFGILFFYAVVIPGMCIVIPISFLGLKRFGDGTGNESSLAEGMQWAMIFGVIFWLALIGGGIWLFIRYT